jgi:hypothetical protein
VYILDIVYTYYIMGVRELIEMYAMNATDVRREWSTVMENAVRKGPQFIKRTRDYMVLADISLLENLLSAYEFTAACFNEADGSVTLSLNELDIVENAPTEKEARMQLGKAILEYAEDYYKEFQVWSAAPNRKGHVPYVLKALITGDASKLGDMIKCQAGRS